LVLALALPPSSIASVLAAASPLPLISLAVSLVLPAVSLELPRVLSLLQALSVSTSSPVIQRAVLFVFM